MGRYLLVMQYCDGGNLRGYLAKNHARLSWEERFDLAKQIIEGLNFLHRENIVHRDLVGNCTENAF